MSENDPKPDAGAWYAQLRRDAEPELERRARRRREHDAARMAADALLAGELASERARELDAALERR